MRLGTYYRSLMLDKLGITANKDFVLDVGYFVRNSIMYYR